MFEGIRKESVSKEPIVAIYSWRKKPHQYGRDPQKRTSGYLNAKVIEDSDTKFNFIASVGNGISKHYGIKVGNRIEGVWKNPPDGGKFYLEKDPRNPRHYKGGINDPYLSDWADLELVITD